MKRTLFTEEHKMFRDAFRRFVEKEIAPHYEAWWADGVVSREVWLKAGSNGFLGTDVPEVYGGGGIRDYRYNLVMVEELARAGKMGVGFPIHNDIVVPYLLNYTSEAQRQRWLPKVVSGECITAIAMTEPDTGSDLAAIRTTARRDGDHYILNGQKTFISNGILNDLVIVVAKTDLEKGHKGISLLAVERGMPGYERGRNLEKIGLHAQDTSELYFKDVHVPAENLLREEGQGFFYLMNQLPQERLTIAASAVAAAEAVLEMTTQYCLDRTAFGRPIGKFQNSRFMLAEMRTEIEVGRSFIDRCVVAHNDEDLDAIEAAMAKLWTTEMQVRVVDQCLQLHGGYGYMMEYPIARAYLDARAQTIHGGTSEIMKEIIGRSLGF
jgi:alkylation response protein AidB-like acyl-CoA dehydrogenase